MKVNIMKFQYSYIAYVVDQLNTFTYFNLLNYIKILTLFELNIANDFLICNNLYKGKVVKYLTMSFDLGVLFKL